MAGTKPTTGVPKASSPARRCLTCLPEQRLVTEGRPLLIQALGCPPARGGNGGVGTGGRKPGLPAQGGKHHLPVPSNRGVGRGVTARPVCCVAYHRLCLDPV